MLVVGLVLVSAMSVLVAMKGIKLYARSDL